MGKGLASPLPVLALPLAFAGCTTPTVVENCILTAAAVVPVFLALAPMAVGVVTRSVDKTLQLLRAPSLWAAVMNSIIWVLFAFVAAKRIECMELVLAYPILLTLNFIYLLMVYGYHKNLWMASILSVLVISCLSYVFYAIKFDASLPLSWETAIGIIGLLILLFAHGCLIDEIKAAVEPLEYVIAVLNVVPPGFLNMATCYIILQKHPEQQYIAYSALIGFICAVLELMLLVCKAVQDKFFGGNARSHAQAAATSAAQAQEAEARVNQIVEALANLLAAGRDAQPNLPINNGNLTGVVVVTASATERLVPQGQIKSAQDFNEVVREEVFVNKPEDAESDELENKTTHPESNQTKSLKNKLLAPVVSSDFWRNLHFQWFAGIGQSPTPRL